MRVWFDAGLTHVASCLPGPLLGGSDGAGATVGVNPEGRRIFPDVSVIRQASAWRPTFHNMIGEALGRLEGNRGTLGQICALIGATYWARLNWRPEW